MTENTNEDDTERGRFEQAVYTGGQIGRSVAGAISATLQGVSETVQSGGVAVSNAGTRVTEQVGSFLKGTQKGAVERGVAIRRTFDGTVDQARGTGADVLSVLGSLAGELDATNLEFVDKYQNGYRIRLEGDVSKYVDKLREMLDVEDQYDLRIDGTVGNDGRLGACVVDLVEEGDDRLEGCQSDEADSMDRELVSADSETDQD